MARYALVVGISHYESEYFESLSKAIIDANAVANLLKQDKRYKNVEVLTGEVTGAKLVGSLKTFLQKQAVKNEGLIYFTGHGFTVVDIAGETEGYLATSDCSVTIEDSQAVGQKGGLPLNTLNKLIQASDLSNLVVLLDACHSGAFLERDLVEQSFKTFGSHTDYYLITGCRSFEEGIAKKREQHSVFTGALVGGLSQDNADEYGKVTGDRLFDFIYTELHSSKQEPIRMGIGRSIVLVEYPSKTKPVTAILDEKGEVICPYQGLQAFDREQKEFFFGRKRLVEAIKQKLDKTPFVPVIGASGSGKSSVVRAGLIPWLEEEGNWQVLEPIKPGFEPLVELRGAFKSFFKGKDEKQLKAFIEDEDKYPKGLANIVERLPGSEQFLLVVDQFEEVFTVCADEEERQRFIQLITQVAEIPNCRLSVVTTMRADFLEPCLRYSLLYQQIQKQAVFMPPLAGIDLRDAITEPARHQGSTIEEELVFRILEDVGKEPGFLPLLEFALTKLWQKRNQEKHLLTLEEYNNLGGLAGALDIHAEQVYHHRDFEIDSPIDKRKEKEQDWIKKIFLRLVRTGEQEKDTRQRQPKSTLLVIAGDEQEALSELLEGEQGLVQGRLLVTGQDTQDAEPWVDLAHEALIEGWHRLAKWRKENRDLRRLIDRLEDALREWKKDAKDDNFMMGGLLAQVREQWEELELNVAPSAKEFYQKSNAREQENITALRQALLREQSARVTDLLSTQPVDASIVAIQATGLNLEWQNEVFSPVQASLQEVAEISRETNVFIGHEHWVSSVAFSSNGQYVVSGSADGTVRLWNLQGESIISPLYGHNDHVNSVAFSPDDQYILSGGNDAKIRLWSLQGKLMGEPFHGHKIDVSSVAFSPNGEYIVSGSRDKTVRLWNRQGNPIGNPFQGHEDAVISVAFSPDGEYIVSGSRDKTVRLWNRQGNPIGNPFQGHEDHVVCVAFSPDNQCIASSSKDGTIRLWDRQGNLIRAPLKGHEGSVFSVAFHPTGHCIASGGSDRTIRLWDSEGNQIREPLRGHKNPVVSVSFSSDKRLLISGSDDKTLRLWDVSSYSNGNPFHGHLYSVNSIAFSSDGQCIVSGSDDGEVRLWDRQGKPVGEPIEHYEAVKSVAFSPDGQYVISSSSILIWLWSLQGSRIGEPLKGHTSTISCLAFSPDGRYIASGDEDGIVALWDCSGDLLCQPFQAHEEFEDDALVTRGGLVIRGTVTSIAFSPDSQCIVTCGDDKTIRLWDLQGCSINEPLRGHESVVNSVAFSPDNLWIISGSRDGTLRLWDRQNSFASKSWFGHRELSVNCVAFSPDSQHIASGGRDGTVCLWNIQGHLVGKPFQAHEYAVVASIAFSPDGYCIISGTSDGKIHSWNFQDTWEAWLEVTCNRLKQHPVFKNIGSKEAESAYNTCQKHIWSGKRSIDFLVRRGKALAQIGDVTGAIAKFREVLEIDPTLEKVLAPEVEVRQPLTIAALLMQGKLHALRIDVKGAVAKFQQALELDTSLELDPEMEARQIAGSVLIKQGNALAKKVDLEGSVAKFQQALELNPSLKLDPLVEARKLVALTLVDQGRELAKNDGDVDGAIAKFKQALKLDPSLSLDPRAEVKQLAVSTLISQGRDLVDISSYSSFEVDVAGAVAKFQKAKELDPSLELDPDIEAKQLATTTLLRQGKELVVTFRDVDKALTKFQQAKELDHNLTLNPEDEVKRLAGIE
jgi:WD40 repeat protein/energy-coupling factor transporter ATP-binding protein EcfA2